MRGADNMVHLFWSGYGFLVAAVTFGLSLITNFVTNTVTGSSAYWNNHKWPLAGSLFLSGMTCWVIGHHLRNRKARVLVDVETGEEVVLRESHTFLFIPMIWWGPILIVCASVALSLEFAN
jgi:hypothetical protein